MKRKDEYMEKAEKTEKRMLKFYAVGFGVGVITLGCLGVAGVRAIFKTKEGKMQPTETTIETTVETTQPTYLIDNINGDYQIGEEKIFAPGEHYICVRVSQHTDGYDNDNVAGAAINNIPDGYEVYSILPYNKKTGYGSATGGYDIWFVNNKTVKAKASYYKRYGNNGYYTFGEVVEEEKQLTK